MWVWVGKEGEEREDINNVRNCLSNVHAREGGGREGVREGGVCVCMFVGCCLATKVFISKWSARGMAWVIIG